ncbi:hypothetical protein DSO57_1023872 [Entomophthora muscae]|uniref:Uncharacterized protein n=1 Tax=Entomophthora muscae TaxID=34485 RepID=A0ACC2TQB2_9FUNG|nr:hypothetical protein DSO57_1023872 [Entomophthora muscae]
MAKARIEPQTFFRDPEFKGEHSSDMVFKRKHGRGGVATEFPDLSANVSYDTQGALDEPPLDVSNIMD